MTQTYDTLFIGANFFGYAREIVSSLERRGHRTIWFEDRPGTDTLTKGLIRLSPNLVAARTEAYFDAIIRKLRGQPIRTVFVIKGEALSADAIRRFRAAFPQARFILYFWDSYRNMPKGSARKVELFDRAFTFDPDDADADKRLTYRPLFYLNDCKAAIAEKQDIDMLFVGTVHSDRYGVLKRIARAVPPGASFTQVHYYPSRAVYQAKRVLRPSLWRAPAATTIFRPLTRPDLISLIGRARIIVDIERSIQSGYTIRTIETIGAGKKLITTNRRIVEADFYDRANHLAIDRRAPFIDPAFIHAPYQPIPAEIIRSYGMDAWLDDIFGQTSLLVHPPPVGVLEPALHGAG